MPQARITTLYVLPRTQILQWIDSTGLYNVTEDAENALADWAGCDAAEVAWDEFDHGEFLTVDGEPLAFIEIQRVDAPVVPEHYRIGRH